MDAAVSAPQSPQEPQAAVADGALDGRTDGATGLLSRGRANAALLALAIGGFTIGTTEFAAMGILTNVAEHLDVTLSAAGWMITAYALGVVVGAPVITVAAARVSRKRLLIALMVVYGLGNILSGFAPSLAALCVARFATGLSHGVFFGVGAVVGTAVVGHARRGQAVAIMMAGLTIANVFGVPLTAWIGDHLGWQASFLTLGALSLLTVAAVVVLIPEVPAGPQASVATELQALRNGPLWWGMAAGAIGFGGFFAAYSYVKAILLEFAGASENAVPWALGLFGIAMTVGALLAGPIVSRSVSGGIRLGFIATGAALGVFALSMGTVAGALIGLVLVGVSSQVLGIAMQTLLMDLSPQAPSLGASLCHAALNLGNANGAFLGGLVIAGGWSYPYLGWLGVVLTCAGLVLIVPALRHHRVLIPASYERPAG